MSNEQNKHTPGPWTIYGLEDEEPIITFWDEAAEQSSDICTLKSDEDDATIKANARLIAAAPDMLDALEYLESVLSEQSEETFERELIRIRAAIAKAEGRE